MLDTNFKVIEDSIEKFSQGTVVVVSDDADRENEGDLIVAASLCTSESMAFIIRHSSGIVCAPLTKNQAEILNLQPMVRDNDAPFGTAFTVSVDARVGITTGISAAERCNTVQALANASDPCAFVRPGHVFPLIAKDGGVLTRAGHTEAAVDLCRLAGLPAVGVIAELMNDDGSVMQGDQVRNFANKYGLHMITIADLIKYRKFKEN
jgi:3,4-dihydroxy 2-butanone 4-phosphate synthase/GTP cyclohydrolase II